MILKSQAFIAPATSTNSDRSVSPPRYSTFAFLLAFSPSVYSLFVGLLLGSRVRLARFLVCLRSLPVPRHVATADFLSRPVADRRRDAASLSTCPLNGASSIFAGVLVSLFIAFFLSADRLRVNVVHQLQEGGAGFCLDAARLRVHSFAFFRVIKDAAFSGKQHTLGVQRPAVDVKPAPEGRPRRMDEQQIERNAGEHAEKEKDAQRAAALLEVEVVQGRDGEQSTTEARLLPQIYAFGVEEIELRSGGSVAEEAPLH